MRNAWWTRWRARISSRRTAPPTPISSILNTCHIREKASEKVYSELGRLRETKDEAARNGRDMKIVVAGCVAQAEGAEIVRRAPVVDRRRRSAELSPSAAICCAAPSRDGRAIETEFPVEDKFDSLPPPQPAAIRARGITVVRHRAGRLRQVLHVLRRALHARRGSSRPVAKIADDVRRLADNGVREITLIGQNVNAFHGEGPDGTPWPLGELLHHLAEIDGIARLRYTTSHPCDVDDSLIAAHRDLPALMPYLHLPVQSGSDRILAAMNRKHTVAEYHRIIERFRAARPTWRFRRISSSDSRRNR